MANNFFKVKNGLNLPTLASDPTATPPENSQVGDTAIWNNEVYVRTASAWEKVPAGPVTDSEIATGTITNTQISNTAAIAGTKISPNFGSQNVSTTGSGSFSTVTTNTQVINANTTADALRITQTGTGNVIVIEDSTNPDSTPIVVNQLGVLIHGTTTAAPSGANYNIQINTDQDQGLGLTRYGTSANPAYLAFTKTRGNLSAFNTIVNNGDALGTIDFRGDDGNGLRVCSSIRAAVDAEPSDNIIPGRLTFHTSDTSGNLTERLRIDSTGKALFANDVEVQGKQVINANTTTDALRVTQTGTGNALVVEDQTNPDSTPFVIDSTGNVGIGTTTPSKPLNVVGDVSIVSGDLVFYPLGTSERKQIIHNVASYQNNFASQTGSYLITLPHVIDNSGKNTFVRMVIVGYDYNDNKIVELVVCGYASSDAVAWSNASAYNRGESARISTVRLGEDSTGKPVVILGVDATSSSYPSFVVKEFEANWIGATALDYSQGWTFTGPHLDTYYTAQGIDIETTITLTNLMPKLNISASSNQLVLSSGVSQLTVNSGTSAAARTYTIPDMGTTANFVMTEGAATINGSKTFGSAVTAPGYIINSSAFNAQTTAYSLQASDNGKIVTVNSATAVNVTVPAGLPVGFNCAIIQLGAGQLTLVASSVTLNSANGLKSAAQHAAISIVSYSSNVYNVSGNTTT